MIVAIAVAAFAALFAAMLFYGSDEVPESELNRRLARPEADD